MNKYLLKSASNESLAAKRPADDEPTWQDPKRPATSRRFSLKQPTLKISNSFSSLPTDSHAERQTETARDVPTKPSKTGQIPPIIMDIPPEWTHVSISNLVSKYTTSFHLKYRGQNKVAIYCYNAATHQNLKDGLRTQVCFHTFSRRDERTPKFVIHGLPASVQDSLVDEIKSLGFNNVIVSKLKTKNPDSAYPPFLVQLSSGEDIPKFKQIKYLCHCVVEVERFKRTNTMGTQCYRCQRFGHAAKNCNLTERCVKCTDQHATKDCPKKDRERPASCCNCNQDHPANYSLCPARQKYLQQMQEKREAKSLTIGKILRSNYADGRSWAAVAETDPRNVASNNSTYQTPKPLTRSVPERPGASRTRQEPDLENHLAGQHESHADNPSSEILQILSAIKSIKEKFSACTSMVDKVILVITHLGQYV